MILEGIVTTLNADGEAHISPMGPLVDAAMRRIVLRPYPNSTTCANLKRTRQGVLHVTDDVELLARAAVGRLEVLPRLTPATGVEGWVLADACRWYAFRVATLDESGPRTRIEADIVSQGTLREFFGFNRAKHAVVEAAILATRTAFLPMQEIQAEFARLAVPVEKTGGEQEKRAFEFLKAYVAELVGSVPPRRDGVRSAE